MDRISDAANAPGRGTEVRIRKITIFLFKHSSHLTNRGKEAT
jgi:hypothetical protein